MNFFTGDGWDDEDELEELSVGDEDEETETGDESAPDQQQQQQSLQISPSLQQQQQHQQQQQDEQGGVALGGGMFMGRLTRFIEAVTQPESEEEEDEEGSGWDESLGLDDDEDDDDDLQQGDGDGWDNDQDILNQMTTNEPPPAPPMAVTPPPPAVAVIADPPMTVSQLVDDSGWDDDLDLSGLEPEPPLAQPQVGLPPSPQPAATSFFAPPKRPDAMVPLNDVPTATTPTNTTTATPLVDHTPAPRYNRNVSFDASLAVVAGSVNTSIISSSEEAPPANGSASGWDDDDIDVDIDIDVCGLLEDIDIENENEHEEKEDTTPSRAAAVVVDQIPPPPPHHELSYLTNSTTAALTDAAVASSSGWDDEDDGLEGIIDDDDEDNYEQPVKMLDHTPPPPPPPPTTKEESTGQSVSVSFAGASTDAVGAFSGGASTVGWDEDEDVLLENINVDDQDTNDDEHKQVVDLTPPPPPPPLEGHPASGTAAAVATPEDGSGWEDDDDLDVDDDDDDEEASATPVVDHTPPPPPPQRMFGRTETNVAICEEDDDISRDDTLSMTNSKHRFPTTGSEEDNSRSKLVDLTPLVRLRRFETTDAVKSSTSVGSLASDDLKQSVADESEECKVVDHTPSVQGLLAVQLEESMAVLGTGSSVGDSLDSVDNSRSAEARPRSRPKMVDLLPPVAKYHRGLSVDASLAVAGHTSLGESMDSIDEEEEESDSDSPRGVRQESTTPGAVEAGWGDRRDYTIAIQESEIPFGSAITPIAAGGTTLSNNFDPETQPDENDDVPLVDHTPLPLVKSQSVAASVDVLSMSSEEGDLGESDDGIDDVKEDLYGQVVDHTPETPKPSEKPKIGNGLAAAKLEDDTVLCVAEKLDVEIDFKQDDDMSDGSSREDGTSAVGTREDNENRSLVSTVCLAIPEEKHLVDHVPLERKAQRTTDASTIVLLDEMSASSRVDDNVADDDATAPLGFGPIVDHTPSVILRSTRSVATSVVTQSSFLETDMKEDEDMDNTIGAAGSTAEGDDEGWDQEQASLTPLKGEEKPLVDHVPKQRGPHRPPIDGSMRVMVDIADDLTQVDTIAEDTVVDFGPIVDHTPFSTRSVAYSVAASIATQSSVGDTKNDDDLDNNTAQGASIEEGPGWDHDEPDLEDILAPDENQNAMQQNNLVDHVPRRSFSRPADASTMVLVDPLDAVSEVDDDDDETDDHARNGRFGLVVDHTPAPKSGGIASVADTMLTQASASEVAIDIQHDDDGMDGTWFGASTVGGVSTVGASITGGGSTGGNSSDASGSGWDDDADVLDDLATPTTQRPIQTEEDHLVDHVPSITSPRPTDASTAVVFDPSVVSSQNKEDNDDNMDGGSFGAVVDHTPSEARVSHHSTANSMVTLETGIATDIKRDEDMDETTWNGGVSAQSDGWDQDEPELEDLVDVADDDEMPHLVDHVPERPDSRPSDASTIVAADPSEMCSQGDDFGQDEGNFGPVVDQTPLSQFNTLPSAAGSTVVALASIIDDDLDDTVENAIEGEDQNAAEEQTGWQEEMPNPQSGNDEDSSSSRELLVDIVPPENDEMPELVRDGSSEMATVDEKSMLPADEAKEDEFGPVVDHTPLLENAASQPIDPRANIREEDSKKAANSSAPSGIQNVDSVASIHSVESKDKDDGLEEDEFGPVVDHLPAVSPRSPFPPSRGGSTVDALATVSEVDDDLITGDGWEEDTEADVPDQASPAAAVRPGEDKNLSVKWIDRLSEKDSAAFLQKTANNAKQSTSLGESGFFDAELGDSSRLSLNETRYYDPELGDSNAWDDSLDFDGLNNLDDGDDTPPSTPRSSTELRSHPNGIAPTMPAVFIKTGQCSTCSSSSTTDCPCVQRLLETNGGSDAMVGKLRTPEGEYVKVNFEQLLQTEVIKRRLIEKESQALRTAVESLKSSKDSLVLAGESQMHVLNKLHESNKGLSHGLSRAREECTTLRLENDGITTKSKDFEEQAADLHAQKEKWQDGTSLLTREMDHLKTQMRQASSAASVTLSTQENKLQGEIVSWQQSNKELSQKIQQFETECANLRAKNESLYEDLAAYRESLSRTEEKETSMLSRESALTAEIRSLKVSMENQAANSSSHTHLQEQMGSIQSDLAAKTGQCAELRSQVASLQQRLTSSEAENFKHTKELARITKAHNHATSDWESRLDASQKVIKGVQAAQASLEGEFEKKLASETATSSQLGDANVTLKRERDDLKSSQEIAMREKKLKLQRKETDLRSAETKLKVLEQEKKILLSEVNKNFEQAKKAEALSVELLSVSRERDVLNDVVSESKSTISSLQKQFDEHSLKYEEESSHHEQTINSLKQERQMFQSDLNATKIQIDQLSQSLIQVASEKSDLKVQCKEFREKCHALEAVANRTKLGTIKDEAKSAKLKHELQELRRQMQVALEERHGSDNERSALAMRCSHLENELTSVMAQLDSSSRLFTSAKSQLNENLEKLRSITAEKEAMAVERDQLLWQCREVEAKSSQAIEEANIRSRKRLADEKGLADLASERDSLSHELGKMRDIIEDYHSKTDSLENEMVEAESLLANKDQIIVILKEQQRSSRSGFLDLQKTNKKLVAKIEDLEGTVLGFDEERSRLTKIAEQHAESMQKLNEEMHRVVEERDTFLRERDMVEDDNEEMLVQFGLLKEQMDANEDKLGNMQQELLSREAAAIEADRNLQESEEKMQGLAMDYSRMNGQMTSEDDMEALRHQLTGENSTLQHRIVELVSQNQEFQSKLQHVESDKSGLVDRVEELQGNVGQLIASGRSKESQLASVIEDAEVQRTDLAEKCHSQDTELSQLKDRLDQSQAMAHDATALRLRVGELEQVSSDHQRLLQQKDGAIQDLQYQLQNAGRAPAESAELETFRRTVQELKERADKDRHNIQELELLSDETTQELRRTMGELSTAELLAEQLQNDLKARNKKEKLYEGIESKLHETEHDLEQATREASSFREESSDLRRRVGILESELQDSRQRFEQPAKEPSGESSAELQSLRQQIEVLKQQQITWTSVTGARKETIEKKVGSLQHEMQRKDGQIAKLEREVHALGTDLTQSHNELASKRENVEKISSELDDVRAQANRPATSRVLELTQDEAESVDQMRSHIISLAKGLEQSESRRAEAIEKLEKERQANADSLRRLTESVKRFYSTLSLGDA